jgi:gliding motility-associated-like protein
MNKIGFLMLAFIFAASSAIFAQNINIQNTNDVPYELDCEGHTTNTNPALTLYDDGGTGNYQTNQSYEMTFISNNGGSVNIYFAQFNLAAGTMMSIRDEVSQEMLVSNASGTTLQNQTIRAMHASVTIIWHSGTSAGAGFEAKVYCGNACQVFTTDINISGANVGTSIVDGEEYFNLCQGTSINLRANNNFLEQGVHDYTQTDGNLIYHWYIINADQDTVTLSSQVPTYTFTEGGGYFILCNAEDQNGCYNSNYNKKKIRVSITPNWNASFSRDSICPGTVISFDGEPVPQDWSVEIPAIIAGAMFIPDGSNSCYSTSLNFDIFPEGSIVNSINDIDRIYFNMEHSFLGDLSLMIQCPNGQNCLLKAKSTSQLTASFINWTNTGGVNVAGSCEGSGTHLGLAYDDGSCNNNAGYGFPYYFYPDGTEGFGRTGTTMSVNRSDYEAYLSCGPSQVQYTSILAWGEEHRYGSYESMTSLIGCPLNGTWTVYVCDLWASDNGWIFEWGLYFRDDLYPDNTWTFNNTYTQSGYSWSGEGMQSGQNGSSHATAAVQNPDQDNWSEMPYTFSATDDFGCTYDTTLLVHVRPAHDSECCIEPTPVITVNSSTGPTPTTPCGNTVGLSVNLSNPSNTGQWIYTGPGTASFSNPNSPTTDVTVNVYGDYTFTWREYYMGNETCNGEASTNVNFARPMDATLDPILDRCRSGQEIVFVAPDFGTLTCTPATDAFNAEARTFTPSLAAPNRYTITNTITGERCASPANSTQSFSIFDEITVSNRTEVCGSGANPLVTISFDVNGVASSSVSYSVSGNYTEYEGEENSNSSNITAGPLTNNRWSFTGHSPLEYALVVTDENGCSSINVPGYYACDCPNYAGAFNDYSAKILCGNDPYTIDHDNHQTLDATGGVFSYIICTDPLDIPRSHVGTLSAGATAVNTANISGFSYGTQYYLVAVAGYGEGLAAWGNGCRSVTQAVPLMWKRRPTPTATGADTCGLVIRLNGSAVPDGMRGYWTATGPQGVTNYTYTTIENTDNTMPNAVVLGSHYGNVTYTWHITNAECTGDGEAIYTFRQVPTPEAGPDMTVCGVSTQITGARQTNPAIEGATVQWTGSGVTMNPANIIQPTANANAGGTYTITLTERNGQCVGTDNLRITFVNVPAPVTTADVDTVCGHTAELQVYNTNPANEGRWVAYDMQDRVVPTVIYHNYNNPQSASSDRYPHCYVTVPIPDEVTEVEYRFHWAEPINDPRLPEDANCMGEADKYVVFRKVPVVSVHQCGSTGNSVTVCGNSVELCAETTASEGYSDFSWVCKDITGSFSDSLATSTVYTLNENVHVTQFQDVDFYFVGRNGSCVSIDTMHVRFLQRPEPSAGLDHIACGNSYELNGVWALQPTDNYTPTCQWTVGEKPHPSAQVIWANTPHDSIVEHVQVSDYGIYTFIVREINTAGDAATCFGRDTVTVEFMEIPNVNAGPDFNVCGLDFQLHAVTSHVEGDSITGQWTSMSGGQASFTDRYDPNTTAHYSAYGPATFRWVETNHPHIQTDDEETCSADDEVTVTFYEIPSAVISMQEGDTAVCGLTFSSLRAENPGDGISGFWYENNPSTQFGPNNITVNSTITDVTVSSYGPHDFYWIEFTGPEDDQRFCKDTAGPWTVTFIQQPSAQLREDQIIFCGKDGQLHVDFNGIGVGRWSTNASSSILTFVDRDDPNTLIHTEVLNSGNYANPYYEIYWTVQNTEYCTDKDTVKVIFAAVPSDSIKVIPPKCFGGPAIVTAFEDTLAIYDWELGNGYIDTTYLNVANGEYRAFIHWEDREETHVIGLTTTNSWGCQSNIGRAIVEEPYLPEYSYTIIGDTCGLGRGGIEFLDTTGLFSFFWIDTTVGPTITNPAMGYALTDFHVYNLPAGVYTYRSDYQTFNREFISSYQTYFNNDIYCHDFPQVEVGTIGMIEAAISVSADVVLSNLVAPNAEVTFVNTTNYDNINNKKCEWHFGDGVVEKNCDELIQHTYVEPGCYEPYLIVMNRDIQECRDTAFLDDCVFVDKESKLEIPNIFSPNGDGLNDYFQVYGQTLKTFHGKILNRYGRVVFEWTDWENEDAGWDGRLNGSTKATPGVYYYIIEAEGYDGQPYNEEGFLNLVR